MITSLSETLVLLSLSFIPVVLLSCFYLSLRVVGRLQGREEMEKRAHFIYLSLFSKIRPKDSWGSIFLALQLTRFCYYLLFAFTFFHLLFFGKIIALKEDSFVGFALLQILIVLAIFVVVDLLVLFFVQKKPIQYVRVLSFPVSLLIFPCLLFVYCYLRGKQAIVRRKPNVVEKLPFRLKDKLLEYLDESEIGRYLDKAEAKLIHTVVSFKDRIVREVMVPRIDVFTISAETTIKEAARCFSVEGYSRIPVHKENIDKIVGVLLYKDILTIYAKHIENKDPDTALLKTVENLVKPALYTPETKKIAQLLQEFRNKQIHLAIVVDEYGGTEGIVTIEDILEELVGEIEDEHDTQETKIFSSPSSGVWVVDAKMSIIDLDEDLGVKIPQSIEYDTIGGYIFHRTGSIPGNGWKVHLDHVDLEVISSDERSIQKIKITERQSS